MILYNRYVNYSVFDGEVTLNKDAKKHLLETVFKDNNTNLDICLVIDGKKYDARLMNVPSSSSVQISYGYEVQHQFEKIFTYSYDYYKTGRAEAKRIGYSTRKVLTQTLESIVISETENELVYLVEYKNYPCDLERRESEECESFPEGRALYKKHISYERKPSVIRLAKERFKDTHNGELFCEVCGFSFQKTYGEDYIEAHHTIPVSQLGENGVTHIEDLKMVCSNCHRILHRNKWHKLLTVEELREKQSPYFNNKS